MEQRTSDYIETYPNEVKGIFKQIVDSQNSLNSTNRVIVSIDHTDHLNLNCGKCSLPLKVKIENRNGTVNDEYVIYFYTRCMNCGEKWAQWRKLCLSLPIKKPRKIKDNDFIGKMRNRAAKK